MREPSWKSAGSTGRAGFASATAEPCRGNEKGRLSPAILHCPARVRTWTLLIQSQTCCQLHHGASNNWELGARSSPPPNQTTYGAEGDRTPDLCIANAALSQLSYSPRDGAK